MVGKSVYSLVLTDEVVAAVDREAYLQNTSRSNLINQILAQHLCMVTPRQMMRDIFSEVSRFMENKHALQIQSQPSDAMFSVRSALRFKYKPTIKYAVELYSDQPDKIGELRAIARTQSSELTNMLEGFYQLWLVLEQHSLMQQELKIPQSYYSEGKYIRTLLPQGEIKADSQELGQAIGFYICALDTAIKTYLEWQGEPLVAHKKITEIYKTYLNNTNLLL